MEPCKGLFWWTGETLICVQISCGEAGNMPGDTGPLAGWNNHRRAWEKLPRAVTQGKPFDYYPRGRVELRRGRAWLFLSPHLCREDVVLQVRGAFGLGQMPVMLKADGSWHYRCYLDEQEENRS